MALHEAMPRGHTAGLPKAESELLRYIAMRNDQVTVANNGDVEVELPVIPRLTSTRGGVTRWETARNDSL